MRGVSFEAKPIRAVIVHFLHGRPWGCEGPRASVDRKGGTVLPTETHDGIRPLLQRLALLPRGARKNQAFDFELLLAVALCPRSDDHFAREYDPIRGQCCVQKRVPGSEERERPKMIQTLENNLGSEQT